MGYSRAFDSFIVGSVMPWGGREEDIPKNWEVGDGRSMNATTNPKYQWLYEIIGIKFGGTDQSDFRLPDLRGNFIRGTANGSANDPDRGSRTALYTGGNMGDQTGSYQIDSFTEHKHTIANEAADDMNDLGDPLRRVTQWKVGTSRDTHSYGANDNRPDNYATIFIIKVI